MLLLLKKIFLKYTYSVCKGTFTVYKRWLKVDIKDKNEILRQKPNVFQRLKFPLNVECA